MDIPLSIKETQEGLLQKKFSAVDLVDSYLANINKLNGDLNAFLTVTSERAYEDAKKVDKLISDYGEGAFKDYPLLGVCVSYKDLFLTKGVRTTAGSKVLEAYVPAYSATVVERLEKAVAAGRDAAWIQGPALESRLDRDIEQL